MIFQYLHNVLIQKTNASPLLFEECLFIQNTPGMCIYQIYLDNCGNSRIHQVLLDYSLPTVHCNTRNRILCSEKPPVM